MIRDLRDVVRLAADVDRLFRARQDGRQMPVGTTVVDCQDTGWRLDPCEWRAWLIVLRLDDPNAWEPAREIISRGKSYFRTRRHVAVLALMEPEHFERCLKEADDLDARHLPSWAQTRLKVVRGRGYPGVGLFRHEEYTRSREKADIARTAAYLQDLDARLSEYREAEAQRAAIKAGRLADAKSPPTEVETMAPEDEAALLQID